MSLVPEVVLPFPTSLWGVSRGIAREKTAGTASCMLGLFPESIHRLCFPVGKPWTLLESFRPWWDFMPELCTVLPTNRKSTLAADGEFPLLSALPHSWQSPAVLLEEEKICSGRPQNVL